MALFPLEPSFWHQSNELVTVRQAAARCPLIATKHGLASLKVVDAKIQSLLRKRAWRTSGGLTPIHMGQDGFTYPMPVDQNSLAALAWTPITEAQPPVGQVVGLHFKWGEIRDGWRLPDGKYRTASMPIPQDTESITHWISLPPGSSAAKENPPC